MILVHFSQIAFVFLTLIRLAKVIPIRFADLKSQKYRMDLGRHAGEFLLVESGQYSAENTTKPISVFLCTLKVSG